MMNFYTPIHDSNISIRSPTAKVAQRITTPTIIFMTGGIEKPNLVFSKAFAEGK